MQTLSYTHVNEDVELIFLSEALDKAIQTLPQREQGIIKSKFYEKKTHKQIGDIYHISTTCVGDIIKKILNKLKKRGLEKYFYEDFKDIKKKREEEKKRIDEEWEKYLKEFRDKLSNSRPCHIYFFKEIEVPFIPEQEVIKEKKQASIYPPKGVYVDRSSGEPILKYRPINYYDTGGNIHRDRDPETYDKWLKYLLYNEEL